jgi:phenylalanine-4-hydroxylase
VTHKDQVLFKSDERLYSMAVGEHIVSAFNGPADRNSFNLINHELSSTSAKVMTDPLRKRLEDYYQQVRDFREGVNTTISRHKVFQEVRNEYPEDWLLSVELYELAQNNGDADFAQEIAAHLQSVKSNNPKVGQLIDDGLQLVDASLVS